MLCLPRHWALLVLGFGATLPTCSPDAETEPDSLTIDDGHETPDQDATEDLLPVDEVAPETAPESIDDRCTRECSPFPEAACPPCPEGMRCTAAGRCRKVGASLGAYCGPTESCTQSTPGWPYCMMEVCESRKCLSVGLDVWLMRHICTQECSIAADVDADGVNDPGAPDDCDFGTELDGPAGTAFRCVRATSSGARGICAPGTNFNVCVRDGDCPPDEGCEPAYIGGEFALRCVARYRENETWPGTTVDAGEACSMPNQYCRAGVCAEPGCAKLCSTDEDCGSEESGPRWTCQPPRPLFPGTEVEFGPVCWPSQATP